MPKEWPVFEKDTVDEMTTCSKCDRAIVAGKCSGCGNPVEQCTCEPAELF